MLLAAMVAFVGTLIAFAGVTALLRGWLEDRRGYLLVFGLTLLCLSVGLGAATIGLALEFRPALFRAYEVGVALLTMVGVALGIVELVARSLPVRFGVRLVAISLSIVVGVILSLDPLGDVADTGAVPAAGELYMRLPLTLLAVAHAAVVVMVSGCFLAVAARAWRGESAAGEYFVSCLLILIAVLFVFVATRPALVPLPPVASTALLTGAAALVWIAPVRAFRAEFADDPEATEVAPGNPAAPESPDGAGGNVGTAENREGAVEDPALAGPRQESKPLSDRTTTRLGGESPQDAGDSMADACGVIVIFTLREGAARPFDRLAAATAAAIREREPGTLIYACHAVADAPQQRIFYELYRDRAAMMDHEQQQHVRRFIAEREQYVLATNVVRLKLNSSTGLPEPQLSW